MIELTYIESTQEEILRSSAKFIFKDCGKDQSATSRQVYIPEINATWWLVMGPWQKSDKPYELEAIRNVSFLLETGNKIECSGEYSVRFELSGSVGYDRCESTKKLRSGRITEQFTPLKVVSSRRVSNASYADRRNDKIYEFICNVIILFNGTKEKAKEMEVTRNLAFSSIYETQRLGNLLDNGNYSDFTIQAGGKEFRVHKNIISLASPVLEMMFNCGLDETKLNSGSVDCDPEIFQYILDFIYKGKFPNIKKEIVLDLYAAAHLYQIEALLKYCARSISNIVINLENALELYAFALKYDVKSLFDDTWEFIKIKMMKLYYSSSKRGNKQWSVDEIKEYLKCMENFKACEQELNKLRINAEGDA